jgi:uncharacterized protein YecT (DUF1311 family)
VGRAIHQESIQEAVQLANPHKEIRTGNFTLDSLAALKDDIKKRAVTSQRYQQEIFDGIERAAEDRNFRNVEYEPQTQQEMNQYAYHLSDLADRELQFVVVSLEGFLGDSELIAFRSAQEAWKKFCDTQAEFESLQAEGGSMQGLLGASARRLLAVERAAQIKEEINKRKGIL